MAAFEITYFDVKDEQEHKHEIEYDGPELSEFDTWLTGTTMAANWCKKNNVCLVSITNICM